MDAKLPPLDMYGESCYENLEPSEVKAPWDSKIGSHSWKPSKGRVWW